MRASFATTAVVLQGRATGSSNARYIFDTAVDHRMSHSPAFPSHAERSRGRHKMIWGS